MFCKTASFRSTSVKMRRGQLFPSSSFSSRKGTFGRYTEARRVVSATACHLQIRSVGFASR
jgi:hypothetical protein